MSGKEAALAESVEINSRSRPPVAGAEGLPARSRICWGLACRGPLPLPGRGGVGTCPPSRRARAGPVAGAGAGGQQCTGALDKIGAALVFQ